MVIQRLSLEQIEKLLSLISNKRIEIDVKYAHEVIDIVFDNIEEIRTQTNNNSPINPMDIILYFVNEYTYLLAGKNKEEIDAFKLDNDNKEHLAAVIADKYLSLSVFDFKQEKIVDKYYPAISSLSLYLNFMVNVVNNYHKKSPETTLIVDLLMKSITISRCIISLLVDGYYTEAYASWRTLHECECTLMLLDKYQEPAIKSYLKHMQYGLAYKNAIKDKEAQDQIFVQIKEEMKNLNLKSKDMKKYIEYGWLTSIPEFNALEIQKFNFRDGLEVVSGLESYNERYTMSSEILHSTPLLIYSNKNYFYFMTLLSTYESFFRLENIFYNFISKVVNKEAIEQYLEVREVYYPSLVEIHKKEASTFMAWQNQHNN